MCGIAGFVGEGSEADLKGMAAQIAHRGPDDEGSLYERGVGMAHSRLSIIDLTNGGHQPMWNTDKSIALVFNGEIYNFRTLKDELRKSGSVFKSNSDTEVILHLYEKEGEECFKKLVGMFAIAIFDFTTHRLILARDRMGEKPLYWSLQDGVFSFASELGALTSSHLIRKEIDLSSLNKYLLFDYVPTPATILRDVYKLEPATYLVYEQGAVRKNVFWHPLTDVLTISETEAMKQLDTHMRASVAGQLVSDAPLGVYLSGGIDSSTIAWYAKQQSRAHLNTFSISFHDTQFDESGYAREVAAHLGTDHHERVITPEDALAVIPQIADVFSEPVADASVIPTLLLSQFARESVKVSLGGDGADELFAGYPTFQAEQFFGAYRRLPGALKTLSRGLINALPASEGNFGLSFNLKKFVSSDKENREERHIEWLGSFPEQERVLLTVGSHTSAEGNALFEDLDRYVDEYEQPDEMNRLLYVYARTYLMDEVLVKVDRASMHYGLEVRTPFLDYRVVEFLFSLPYSFKYKNFQTKRLLKKLMEDRLPESILHRKKKGFGIPLAGWLKNELKPLCEELLSEEKIKTHGLFSHEYVVQLKTQHLEGRMDNRKQLWNLMVFQMWYDRWMR